MTRTVLISIAVLGSIGAIAIAQQPIIEVNKAGEKPSIAVPDFRGAGEAQQFMSVFNRTLWDELQNSGQLRMVAKGMYPLQAPQQPSDLRRAPQTPSLTQWSSPPANANYLAFGYTAVQNGNLVLFGWLDNTTQPANPQVLGKVYVGMLDQAGAIKVARDFASDILQRFGVKSLAGTKILFVSDRSGHKEIWSMDYDGANQKQLTHYGSITTFPAVSFDSTKLACTTFAHGLPQISIFSLESNRRLPFYNQSASMNAASDFMPDNQHILLYSTAAGGPSQIYIARTDGSDWRRITHSRSIEVEPKINPKTGAEIVFVSGRSGPEPQLYRMNVDGADVVRLTNGQGEAVNPSWNPDGQHIAFAWTRGFEPGSFNIFVMDVASRETVQLTHGEGRNENPSWAPDGVHLVYSSRRGRSIQIWTMLANGTGKRQLTTVGNNEKPVWGKAAQ